jgi:predicted RNase H-like HicB family nuclease
MIPRRTDGQAREAIELCLEEEADDVEPLIFVGIQKVSVG